MVAKPVAMGGVGTLFSRTRLTPEECNAQAYQDEASKMYKLFILHNSDATRREAHNILSKWRDQCGAYTSFMPK